MVTQKLRKSLYGWKQAFRKLYAKLTDILYAMGYHHSSNDYSLLHKKTDNSVASWGVYVNDSLSTGNDELEFKL